MLYKEQVEAIIKRLEREKRQAEDFYERSGVSYQQCRVKLLEEKIASYKRLYQNAHHRKTYSPFGRNPQNRARFAMDVRYNEHNKNNYLKDL